MIIHTSNPQTQAFTANNMLSDRLDSRFTTSSGRGQGWQGSGNQQNYRSSRDYNPTNASSPCPVCGDTKGKCRLMTTDQVLCMSHQEPLAGWSFTGPTSNGLWGKYWPEGDSRPRQHLRVVPEKEEVAKEWTPHQWNRHYLRIQEQASLCDADKQDLIDRLQKAGLDETHLPALGAVSLSKGYIIPIPSHDGQLIGAQIRLRGDVEGGRYRWDATPQGIDRHINGELALSAWGGPSDTVAITEGTGIKPYIASQLLGYRAVGAAGGLHASSPKLLQKAVEGASIAVIVVDAGAIDNRHVLGQYKRTQELLESWGLVVLFLWWGQKTKAHGDIDEGIDLSAIQRLTPAQFWGMVGGPEPVPFTRPQKSTEEFTAATLMEWLSRRTFTPSIVVSSQYLTEIPMGQSLAIKSGMGTGKTYQIAQLCDKWDGGVILLGSRNGLLLQTKERINEVVQTNLKKLAFIHSDADSWQLRDPHGRVAACVDSLTRFDPESFFGKLVFIDEAQAVLMHLLIGSTVAGRRAVILERFEECLRCAAAIVALDGNLSDRVVAYLEQVSGKTITKLENKHQLTVLDVTLLEPEKARDKSYLQGLAFQALEQGHNIAFVADSQRECEAMDKLCFEQGWKAFRVDSKTMADKEFKKLVQSPTLGHDLAAMGVRCLILSPSAESGLDVSTKGYFSKGFGSFYGVIDTNSQTQILRRVREITDWTVECVEYTQVQTQGPRSSFANTLGRYKLEAVIAELTAAGMAGGDVQVWLDHLKAFTTPHAALSIAFEAGRNYERSATRDCLERALLDQGHRVNRIGCSADEQTKERMKAAKEEIVDRDAAQLMAAESNMTPAEAARKLQSFNCTLDERFQAQRTLLLSRIPGVEHSNLWGLELVRELAFTNKKVLGQLERLWLAQNIDLATNRAQAKVKTALDGKTFMADLVPYLARLQYLISLGLLALIGDGEWYTSESEVIKSAYERAKRSRKAKVLGLAPASGDTPIKWVSRLLKNLFGVTSESVRFEDGRNYKYGLPVHADLLPFVAIHMQKTFAENCIADWPQTPTQPSVETLHSAPIDLTHGETDSTEPVSEPPSNDLPILNFGGFDWYVGTVQGQESVCWVGNDPSVLANWWPFEATFEKYSAA